jgi:UDP-N-acetylenolpyruvoylglucosamine reductase
MSMAAAHPPVREFVAEFKQRLDLASAIRLDEPLSKHTTLRVGGPADLYIEPADEADLARTLEICREHTLPWLMLGRGSNLLVRDGGIRAVVIHFAAPFFSRIIIDGQRIHCGAGARLRSIAFEAKKASLTSFEFMEGIPGNLGGALRMNAGAMGSATFQLVETVRTMSSSGEIKDLPAAEIPVEYRNCPLLRTQIALGATLSGKPAARDLIEQKMNECSQKRWSSQPAAPSAGCIFKNSPTVATGRLVEDLGLKGTRRGGAVISDVHGNFIVNDGNASSRDIIELIEVVKDKAMAERGIDLQTEVQIVGED